MTVVVPAPARERGSVHDTAIDQVAADRFAASLGGHRLKPLAVVIAAYNEFEAIGSVLAQVPSQVCGLGVDVVVVVDGATDGTAAAARGAAAARPGGPAGGPGVFVCDVPVNRGQGAALRLGYRLSAEHGAQYIATLDADGQYDPAQLDDVVAPLLDGTADFVSGSRRLGNAYTTDRLRSSGVVVFAALISMLTRHRITDPANGLRAMRAVVPASVTLEQPQYQASELLVGALLAGFRVVEVPVTMYLRTAGTSKKGHNFLYGARFARAIFATWWRGPARRSPA